MRHVVLFFGLVCFFVSVQAKNYYVNSLNGTNSNKGTSINSPWKTTAPLSTIQLEPGDSILFATGQTFTGTLLLQDVHGTQPLPIVVASYSIKGNHLKPILDAGDNRNVLVIQNSSFIVVQGIEVTGTKPFSMTDLGEKSELRCGILVEVTKNNLYNDIVIKDVTVHDVYYYAPGYKRSAAETASANGTQSYGWGIRFMNHTIAGKLTNVKIEKVEIFNVSHTGLKFTATTNGITYVEVVSCNIHDTGGPGLQMSGVTNAHIHKNEIDHSGSNADSRHWGRGSGMWTWGCSNILIEHNLFKNANGPGDSAGVHIDFNCSDVVVQYNISANNAGGFCEILGNNYNCAYRYNISVNDGYRIKGEKGAFQEGKIFWLSGYVGNQKPKKGPYNSYFYNNSIYVSSGIVPKIAISTSSQGVLIANNIFYFEKDAQLVAGDQKKYEVDAGKISHVIFLNNLFLHSSSWPADLSLQDASPYIGNPDFKSQGGLAAKDYMPNNLKLVSDKGIVIQPLPHDSIGLRIGLKVDKDILGNPVTGNPDLGAIEIISRNKK